MSPKTVNVTEAVAAYMAAHNPPLDDVAQSLIRETQALGDVAGMQIAPEQGAFMTLLARILGARLAVEVGTFTGYSALCVARGLAPGGRLICCDVSDEWTSVARRHWALAGVADRIELRLAPAAETLAALPLERTVDLAFIDADKGGYDVYYEELIKRMRPGGIILVDNVLWSGRVADPGDQDENTTAIRAFNSHVAGDERCVSVMLPIADGLTLIRRRD